MPQPQTPRLSSDPIVPTAAGHDRRKRLLICGAALVVLAVGAGVALTGGDSSNNSGNNSSKVTDKYLVAPAPEGRAKMVLLVDGWSYATLRDLSPTYRPIEQVPLAPIVPGMTGAEAAPVGQQPAAAAVPLTFAPVTEGQLVELAKDTPDVLTRTAARMFSSDLKLSCTDAGCTSSTGEIPLEWFTSPSKSPLGAMYDGYDVRAGLYAAVLDLPQSATQVAINANGFADKTLSVATELDPELGEEVTPNPTNGYFKGRFLLSAAYGRLFAPAPAWVGSDTAVRYRTPAPVGTSDAGSTLQPRNFLQGHGVAVAGVADINDDLLTYLSSPSTGCGGALCIPGKAQVSDVKTNIEKAAVCSAAGQRQLATFTNTHMTVTFAAPTRQFGLWNGKTPTPAKDEKAVVPATTELVTGKQSVRFGTVQFFDGPELALVNMATRINQAPHDSAEIFAQPFGKAQLAQQPLSTLGVKLC